MKREEIAGWLALIRDGSCAGKPMERATIDRAIAALTRDPAPLTPGERAGLVEFLKGLRHAGHLDGRGCLGGSTGVSCHDCIRIDRAIAAFTREREDDSFSAPIEQVRAELKAAGIDTQPLKDFVRAKLAEMRTEAEPCASKPVEAGEWELVGTYTADEAEVMRAARRGPGEWRIYRRREPAREGGGR